MKIFDCFIFYNEIDMLELRLATLYDYVDKFVIVEADHTFTNRPKDFNLELNWDRFKKWEDKIVYIKAHSLRYSNPWHNETWQRNQIINGLKDATSEDIITLTDVDEIIRPETFDYIKNTDYDLYGLLMPVFYFKFNYLDTKPNWHYKVWGRAFRGIPNTNIDHIRYSKELPGKSKTIALHHAGWHFGWAGDEQFVKNKIQSFSHTEINQPHITENINIEKHIKEGRDHFRPENVTWCAVNLDNYFPKFLLENKQKYSTLILPDSGKVVQDYWNYEILEPTEWL